MNLSEAKVLVTGGSEGIGREVARLLAARGAQVAICGRRREELERAASDVGAYPIVADVSSEDDVERLVEATIDQLVGLNVLINNAGIGTSTPLVETTADDMRRVWETNVLGAMLVGRAAARHFVTQNRGHIVNIGSTAGQRGYPGGTVYASSKFALRGMSECWRAELRFSGVRVTYVAPSEVQTGFGGRDIDPSRPTNETKLRPAEIAHTIAGFLEMDDRGFIPELSVWATNPRSRDAS